MQTKKVHENKNVTEIKEYVAEHLYERILVAEIASQLRLHPSYMTQLFKVHEGVTVVEYIQNAKLTEAERLLERTEKSVSEIYTQLGYYDQSHFTRKFKAFSGYSPLKYRKISRERS